jgi:hypothetical protein
MTNSSTTKVKAANTNGGDTTDKPAPVQREHGIDRLREEECYHLTGLVDECLREAEHLVKKIHNKAFNRTLDHDGTKGTQPLDRAEVVKTLNEAYDCAALALAYIFSVSSHLRDEVERNDPWAAEPAF